MNEIIHGYVVSVILAKFRINANIQLWQSFSILNFGIGIVSDFLQYINPCIEVILIQIPKNQMNIFEKCFLQSLSDVFMHSIKSNVSLNCAKLFMSYCTY